MAVAGDDSTVAAADAGAAAAADATMTTAHEGVVATPPADAWVETDRYAMIEEIGRGGGGRIAIALDRKLGRRVALKRPIGGGATRLEREARVMARLEHPGIVPVHDAGRDADGTPFYAMKLVGGADLGARVRAAPTLAARLALVRVVGAVADAIAYAHAQGVIHRDLKPANVVVGEFGEVAVIDWGLAKVIAAPGAAGAADVDDVHSSVSAELTADGAVVGTPAYMAPEQALGAKLDARTDVYALGAMLYHVLGGGLPYGRGEGKEQLARLAAGPPPPVEEREPRVPRELAAIVGKAMARDPAARYPTARDFAEDLARYQTGRLVAAHRYTPSMRARKWLRRHPLAVALAIGAVAVAGAAAFVVTRPAAAVETCIDLDRPVRAVWNDGARAAIGKAFDATGVKYARVAHAMVVGALDDRAARIDAMRLEACHAHARGEQSERTLDQRMACLDERLGEVGAVAGVMAAADRQVVANAASALGALGSVDDCADLRRLGERVPLPSDPAQRREAIGANQAVSDLIARDLAGQVKSTLGLALPVVTRALASGYPPAIARALFRWGSILDDHGDAELAAAVLRAALVACERARDDELRGGVLITLSYLEAVRRQRFDEADRLADEAEAVVDRAGSAHARARLLSNRSVIARNEGHEAAAIEFAERTVAVTDGPAFRLLERATAAAVLGNAYSTARRFDDADRALRRGLALYRQAYGTDVHPDIARTFLNLGANDEDHGQHDAAIRDMQQAIAIFARTVAPDSQAMLIARTNLAVIETSVGRYDEAEAELRWALPIAEQKLGRTHTLVSDNYCNLGDTLDQKGELDAALAAYHECEARRLEAGAPEAKRLDVEFRIASVLRSMGRSREAVAALEPVLTAQERTLGPDVHDTALTRGELGLARLDAGDARGAISALTRALVALDAEGNDAASGDYRFGLARAQWATGDRAAARVTAAAARTHLVAAGAKFEPTLRKLDAWLAAHP